MNVNRLSTNIKVLKNLEEQTDINNRIKNFYQKKIK